MTMGDWPLQPEGGPEDRVDPSEFWKDDPEKADGYANLFVSEEEFYSPRESYRDTKVIAPDMLAWLNENAGPRRAYGLEFYQNPQDFDWSVRGDLFRDKRTIVQICIRDLKAATLFKLKYGGL